MKDQTKVHLRSARKHLDEANRQLYKACNLEGWIPVDELGWPIEADVNLKEVSEALHELRRTREAIPSDD